ACVASTAAAQPEIVPPSVAKMKDAARPGAGPTRNAVEPLTTIPVQTVLPPFPDGGMIALVVLTAKVVALAVYTVERPVPPSHTKKGLAADIAIPQTFTALGSTVSATPAVSAIRLCTKYPVAPDRRCGARVRSNTDRVRGIAPTAYDTPWELEA